MSKIKIICTSTGCLEYAPERYHKSDIDFIRVHVHFKGNEYLEGPDLNPDEFYKALENVQDVKNDLPHTSIPTSEEIKAVFEKALKEGYEEVIVIVLSAYLGGTWNFIRLNAEDYRDKFKSITVVDAKVTCFQEGLLAIKAHELAEQGKDVPAILQEIEWMKERQEFIGCAARLDYMILNGRLKGGKAYFGKLMNICPVIHFNHQGELTPLANAMGMNKALQKAQETVLECVGDRDPKDYTLLRLYTGKTMSEKQMKWEEKTGLKVNHEDVVMTPVTGCHVGPWCVGYAYTPIRRDDEPLPEVPDYYYQQNNINK